MNDKIAEVNNKPQTVIIGGEDPDLNFLERFKRFEKITQISIGLVIFFCIAVIFWMKWFNYRWWLVWPLALFILRNLHRQRISLSKDKPFESRVNNLFFVVFIILLAARDLILTIITK